MAESKQHQYLVARLDRAVTEALGGCIRPVVRVDGKLSKGVAPRNIGGYRPDVYAFNRTMTVIGEAKPPEDLETERSRKQLKAFVRFVEADLSRHLVLSVHWTSAVTARILMREAAQQRTNARFHVLDGVRPLVLLCPDRHERA